MLTKVLTRLPVSEVFKGVSNVILRYESCTPMASDGHTRSWEFFAEVGAVEQLKQLSLSV